MPSTSLLVVLALQLTILFLLCVSLALDSWQVHENNAVTVRYGLFKNCTLHSGDTWCEELIEKNNSWTDKILLAVRILLCIAAEFVFMALLCGILYVTCLQHYKILPISSLILTGVMGLCVLVGCILYGDHVQKGDYSFGLSFMLTCLSCILSWPTAFVVYIAVRSHKTSKLSHKDDDTNSGLC